MRHTYFVRHYVTINVNAVYAPTLDNVIAVKVNPACQYKMPVTKPNSIIVGTMLNTNAVNMKFIPIINQKTY